jgi:hypothetical protein
MDEMNSKLSNKEKKLFLKASAKKDMGKLLLIIILVSALIISYPIERELKENKAEQSLGKIASNDAELIKGNLKESMIADWEKCPADIEIKNYVYPKHFSTSGSGIKITGTYSVSELGNKTKSMLPSIVGGNRVIIKPINEDEIAVGMIVMTKESYAGLLDMELNRIVHRVVKIEDNTVWLKGDNNYKCDVWQREDIDYAVIGVIY